MASSDQAGDARTSNRAGHSNNPAYADSTKATAQMAVKLAIRTIPIIVAPFAARAEYLTFLVDDARCNI